MEELKIYNGQRRRTLVGCRQSSDDVAPDWPAGLHGDCLGRRLEIEQPLGQETADRAWGTTSQQGDNASEEESTGNEAAVKEE